MVSCEMNVEAARSPETLSPKDFAMRFVKDKEEANAFIKWVQEANPNQKLADMECTFRLEGKKGTLADGQSLDAPAKEALKSGKWPLNYKAYSKEIQESERFLKALKYDKELTRFRAMLDKMNFEGLRLKKIRASDDFYKKYPGGLQGFEKDLRERQLEFKDLKNASEQLKSDFSAYLEFELIDPGVYRFSEVSVDCPKKAPPRAAVNAQGECKACALRQLQPETGDLDELSKHLKRGLGTPYGVRILYSGDGGAEELRPEELEKRFSKWAYRKSFESSISQFSKDSALGKRLDALSQEFFRITGCGIRLEIDFRKSSVEMRPMSPVNDQDQSPHPLGDRNIGFGTEFKIIGEAAPRQSAPSFNTQVDGFRIQDFKDSRLETARPELYIERLQGIVDAARKSGYECAGKGKR